MARWTGEIWSQWLARLPRPRVAANSASEPTDRPSIVWTSQRRSSQHRSQRRATRATTIAASGRPSIEIDSQAASARPAIQPPIRGLRAIKPLTARRTSTICQPWWSIRIGRNWVITGTESAVARQARPATSSSNIRQAMRPTSNIAQPSVNSGITTRVTASARGWPSKGRSARIMAASGMSTSRDQCMATPPAAASTRCWWRSNQPCPAIRSRTWIRRRVSSGSGKRISAMATALVSSISTAITVQASATRGSSSGPSGGRRRSEKVIPPPPR